MPTMSNLDEGRKIAHWTRENLHTQVQQIDEEEERYKKTYIAEQHIICACYFHAGFAVYLTTLHSMRSKSKNPPHYVSFAKSFFNNPPTIPSYVGSRELC
jgi:hypothetical protein